MMGRSSMSKQMMREGGKVKPKKKESKDSKQARADSKALVGNLNLSPKEKMGKKGTNEDQYTIKGDPDPGASEREFNKALYARRAKEKKLALEKLEQIKKARAEGKTVDMARGGMTKRMMGASNAPESGPTKRMVPRVPRDEPPMPDPEQGPDTPTMESRRRGRGMARGGMTKRMMGASNAPESGPTKPMVSPKPKPKGPAPYDDSDPKPRKMKSGGKVRGYGMARGGKACKMR